MSKDENKAGDKAEEKKEESAPEQKPYYGEPIKEGDMIKLEKMGRTLPDAIHNKSIVFEASTIEDAKQMPNFDPQKAHLYTPELIIVGKKGYLLDKLDEELKTMKYGEEKLISLEPKDAYGERDFKNIEIMSRKKFLTVAKKAPQLGMDFHDEKKNRHGQVVSVDQGRVRVDYNHPLAGKKVEYKLKAIERIDEFDDKVKALVERLIPNIPENMLSIKYDENTKLLTVVLPSYVTFQQQLGYIEYQLSYDLQTILDVGDVHFVHEFKKTPIPEAAEESGEKVDVDMSSGEVKLDLDDKDGDEKESNKSSKKSSKKTSKKKSSKKSAKKSSKKTSKKKSSKKSSK